MHKKTLLGMKLLATSLLLSGGIALSGNRAYATELDNEVVAVGSEQNDSQETYEVSDDGVMTIKGNIDLNMIKSMARMFPVEKIIALEGTVLPEDCEDMFTGYVDCRFIDLSKADTSKVTNMTAMFMGLEKLESINLSNFDTSNVTSMRDMFDSCKGLTSLDLSSFDTSNVKL